MISSTNVTRVEDTEVDKTERYSLLNLLTESICCFKIFDTSKADDDEEAKRFEKLLEAELVYTSTRKKR